MPATPARSALIDDTVDPDEPADARTDNDAAFLAAADDGSEIEDSDEEDADAGDRDALPAAPARLAASAARPTTLGAPTAADFWSRADKPEWNPVVDITEAPFDESTEFVFSEAHLEAVHENLAASKSIVWQEEGEDFQNKAFVGDRDCSPKGPEPGLRKEFWCNLHEAVHPDLSPSPTVEQIYDPLFLFFIMFQPTLWLNLGHTTDKYAANVEARVSLAFRQEKNRDPKGWKPWRPLFAGGMFFWHLLIRFWGILIYRSATKKKSYDHWRAWDSSGYEAGHGFYDSAIAKCMPFYVFAQIRRYMHWTDNESREAKNAANKAHADYDPCYKISPIYDWCNAMWKKMANPACTVAIDEITVLSFVYGPTALMKRTPGKKVSQGFQSIAMVSKYVIDGFGLTFVHGFLWDLNKQRPNQLPHRVDPGMSDTMNNVLLLCLICLPAGSEYYTLYQDNRFNQVQLILHLWYCLHLFVVGTFRANYIPASNVKAHMFPAATWAKAAPTDNQKRSYRDEPARMSSFLGVTIKTLYDTGFTRLVMSTPGHGNHRVQKTKQRRKTMNTAVKKWMKDEDADEYTQKMDNVDVNDHRLALMPILLMSWKWTWAPVCWMMTEGCIMIYATHVMLVSMKNNDGRRSRHSTQRLKPMDEKDFRRVLGLKMMDYHGDAGYWFEAESFFTTSAGQNSESARAYARPAVAAAASAQPMAKPKRGPKPTSNSTARFSCDEHEIVDLPRGDKGQIRQLTCRFCGNRTARSMCLTCPDRPALHHPRTTGGQAPNVEWPCSRLYHDQSCEAKWCHSEWKDASAEFNAHPQVTALGKKQAVRNKPNKSKAASPYIFAPKR